MRRRARALAGAIVLAAALAVGASGCSAAAPDITVGTSELMQSTIVAAADQAAAGDSVGALTTLDSLQSQLETALGKGEVSASRAASIQESIDLVRSDLQPAAVETPAPAETVAPAAPAETATPADTVTPVDTSVPEDTGGPAAGNGNSGNNGSGNGNGNGNGNGPGNGNGNGNGPGKK